MSIYATDDCVQCNVCLYSCPYDVIELYDEEDPPTFDQARCRYCGECEDMCPVDCIIVDNEGQGDSTFVFDDGLFLDISDNWLGMPFNSGDEGPDSTDCSGLIWGVYDDMGYDYIRCSTSGFSSSPNWIQVDSMSVRNGDIVVWPGVHSGIYYNNGSNNVFYAGMNGVGWWTVNGLINWFSNNGVTTLPIYFRYNP